MSRRPRSLFQRVRDHIGFSVVAIGVLFILLRLLGVRSTFAGFALSVVITLGLNVGLSYYHDHRARNPRPQRQARGGGDIRFREGDRRDDPRDVDPRDVGLRDVDVRERAEPRRRGQHDENR
ncbi:hypothetical protein [Brachybacterium vulturis]|uniref:hypothetical protein n=1 Tax=Brachybacterium vulturis TaxID=2017484 RepID=UPI0037365657